jgi:cell wall-associated NlpC family hydrolase
MVPLLRGVGVMSLSRVVAAAVLAIAAAGGGLGLVTVSALGSPANTRLPACVSSGPVSGLSDAQAQNARTIVAVAAQRGGEQAAFIAVMVALAESDLRVLANPNDPTGDAYPNQGVGYDHDSLGLFQQRPGWGTAAQRMSPIESTNLFLDALDKVPGWQEMTPWYAAQMVQRSAFAGMPNARNGGSSVVGENYQRRAERAAAVLGAIQSGAVELDCGAASLATLAPGGAGRHGLPDGYAIPAGTSQPGQVAVSYALAQLGKPYLWGGNGPDAFDCSGLMQQAWLHAGVPIGRVVSQQLHDGVPTTLDQLLPGDMVMIPGTLGTMAAPGHVGMYIGYGLVVNAPRTGDVVRVVSLKSFVSDGLAGLRHVA